MGSVMELEEIKAAVLQAAEIEKMNKAFCVKLSDLICQKTGKRISVTTIKRVYGFAARKFNISPYTISVLAEFTGYYAINRKEVRKQTVIEITRIVNKDRTVWDYSVSA